MRCLIGYQVNVMLSYGQLRDGTPRSPSPRALLPEVPLLTAPDRQIHGGDNSAIAAVAEILGSLDRRGHDPCLLGCTTAQNYNNRHTAAAACGVPRTYQLANCTNGHRMST